MLSTLKATLSPSGALSFDDPVRITEPVRVLVTLLDEHLSLEPSSAPAAAVDHRAPGETTEDPLAGEDPARAQRWRELLALRERAIDEGMHLMGWDEVNAEVRERRGGVRND